VKRSIPRACEKWLREEEEFVEVELSSENVEFSLRDEDGEK